MRHPRPELRSHPSAADGRPASDTDQERVTETGDWFSPGAAHAMVNNAKGPIAAAIKALSEAL